MMQYQYLTCDVFTTERFGGNPLAVLPDARGLDTARMQQIAREFNYSESTFVFPAQSGFDRRVRIFTPAQEIPFAGHPNIGTAFVLAREGLFGDIGGGITMTFEEDAGTVPVTIRHDDQNRIWCELKAPQALSLGDTVSPGTMAGILSLDEADVVTHTHPPRVASVGLPFLVVEVANRDALQRAHIDLPALESLRESGVVTDIHVYTRSDDDFDIRARMFAPFHGTPEDPATGSANVALAALLAHEDSRDQRDYAWRIAQGVEMGRASVLDARCRKEHGNVSVWVGGHSVAVSKGVIELD